MTKILDPGFYDLSAGQLATVVTSLEMLARPHSRPESVRGDWKLEHWQRPEVEEYQTLFRQIGEDWLWFSRLVMTKSDLTTIIHNPQVEIYRMMTPSGTGLLELDLRHEGECELAFFGLSPELQGQGAGRWLMNRALEIAWAKPIKRFWVHTCSLDHHAALDFYQRSGFIPYKRQIEIAPDPRLTGKLPRSAAPHVPLLKD